jgi:O-antigen/teichoic acid export membrane protein
MVIFFKKIKLEKNFIIYSSLNFLEKFLAYVAPLLVLKLIGNQKIYNNIEFIYSLGLILNIFFDFGIRGFLIYSFRFKNNIYKYTFESFKFLNSILILYIIVFGIFYFFSFNFFLDFIIISLIFFRAIYLLIVNFLRVLFRIINKPIQIFFYSLIANLAVCILIFYFFYSKTAFKIEIFFFPFLLFILIYYFYFLLTKNFEIKINKLIIFISKSIKYYWPLMIISLVSIFIGNFVKIFSYFALGDNEMTRISIYLRYLLIIQLAHASFSSFFLRKNFETKKKIINKNLFTQYLFIIVFFSIFVILTMPVISNFINFKYDKFDLIFLSLNLYILMWCISAYLEQFLNKYNQNKYILKFHLVSLVVYFSIFLINYEDKLLLLSLSMLLSTFTYFVLILLHLKKFKFSFK